MKSVRLSTILEMIHGVFTTRDLIHEKRVLK